MVRELKASHSARKRLLSSYVNHGMGGSIPITCVMYSGDCVLLHLRTRRCCRTQTACLRSCAVSGTRCFRSCWQVLMKQSCERTSNIGQMNWQKGSMNSSMRPALGCQFISLPQAFRAPVLFRPRLRCLMLDPHLHKRQAKPSQAKRSSPLQVVAPAGL